MEILVSITSIIRKIESYMLNIVCVCHTISGYGIVYFETKGFWEEFGSHLCCLDFVIQGQNTAVSTTFPLAMKKLGFRERLSGSHNVKLPSKRIQLNHI